MALQAIIQVMPPIILEVRYVTGGGRYLKEVRISTFLPNPGLPEGIRYSLWLVELQSGKVILLYDVHPGKSRHRHLRGEETAYHFAGENILLDDFFREVSLILEEKL